MIRLSPKLIAASLVAAAFIWAVNARTSESATSSPNQCSISDKAISPVHLVLRSDFGDFGIACASGNIVEATGAQASYTYNELTNQPQMSVDGVGAAVWRYYGHSTIFEGIDFGLYLQGDGSYQISTKTLPAKDIDTVTSGACAQFGFVDALLKDVDYFRVRAGYTDRSSTIGSTTAVLEWLPLVGFNCPAHICINVTHNLGPGFFYLLSPELLMQYDALDSGPNKYRLFLTKAESLRIGPQVGIKLLRNPHTALPLLLEPLAPILDQTSLSLSYHASSDVYAGREYGWTSETLTLFAWWAWLVG